MTRAAIEDWVDHANRAVQALVAEAEAKGHLATAYVVEMPYAMEVEMEFGAGYSRFRGGEPTFRIRKRESLTALRDPRVFASKVMDFVREARAWINPPALEPVEPHLRRGRSVTVLL